MPSLENLTSKNFLQGTNYQWTLTTPYPIAHHTPIGSSLKERNAGHAAATQHTSAVWSERMKRRYQAFLIPYSIPFWYRTDILNSTILDQDMARTRPKRYLPSTLPSTSPIFVQTVKLNSTCQVVVSVHTTIPEDMCFFNRYEVKCKCRRSRTIDTPGRDILPSRRPPPTEHVVI